MRRLAIMLLAWLLAGPVLAAAPVRIKDLGKFAGWRDNQLTGYGIVTGLAGSGDSSANKATRQALANLLAHFDAHVSADHLNSRNAALVMVTATLPPFAAAGAALDVTVTSMGDARSLAGGSLLLTPLKAANNRVYALAQGAVSVGGYKYDMHGSMVQKNHPTVGTVPAGATVEVAVQAKVLSADGVLLFQLAQADYTTAARIAAAVNGGLGAALARARDAESIEIRVPEAQRSLLVDFIGSIESLTVQPDWRARVVVNERTGTVVAGGEVRIARVAIAHGELKVSIVTEHALAPALVLGPGGPLLPAEGVANARLEVREQGETVAGGGDNTVADLIRTLARIKTPTRDVISILRALKAAGALHAELVIE
ncbi:MAG: flagellar biosynthesis protein FlgI [Pseudoduganella sp.]|jgi:flagellar P-ring protein precursor FlgI|nr:flagellar biosynthesis protein FlgI [Pseudoduganella sp.]